MKSSAQLGWFATTPMIVSINGQKGSEDREITMEYIPNANSVVILWEKRRTAQTKIAQIDIIGGEVRVTEGQDVISIVR